MFCSAAPIPGPTSLPLGIPFPKEFVLGLSGANGSVSPMGSGLPQPSVLGMAFTLRFLTNIAGLPLGRLDIRFEFSAGCSTLPSGLPSVKRENVYSKLGSSLSQLNSQHPVPASPQAPDPAPPWHPPQPQPQNNADQPKIISGINH